MKSPINVYFFIALHWEQVIFKLFINHIRVSQRNLKMSCLLGRNTAQEITNRVHKVKQILLFASFLLCLFFHIEDGDSTYLRNIDGPCTDVHDITFQKIVLFHVMNNFIHRSSSFKMHMLQHG
jgi:hypothetical protein